MKSALLILLFLIVGLYMFPHDTYPVWVLAAAAGGTQIMGYLIRRSR